MCVSVYINLIASADSNDTLRYIVSFAANDDSISNAEYEFIYQTAEAAII
jgi:hypothetical protein